MEKKNSVIDKSPNKKRYILYIIIFVIITLTILVGVAYAAFGENYLGNKTTSIKAGKNLTFKYNETSEGLVSVSEKTDTDGKNQENYFDFDVVLTSDEEQSVNYIIYLTKTEGNLPDEAIKVYLTNQENSKISGPVRVADLANYSKEENSKIIYQNTISGTGTITHNYRLRAWINEEYQNSSANINKIDVEDGINITTISQSYKFKVNVKVLSQNFLNSEILKQGIVSSGDGLYVSTATNDGRPTYYYHGAVENNYVDFANLTWRVIRINEDGTIRMIAENAINNNTKYAFNKNYNTSYEYMYYSNSDVEGGIKKEIDAWYTSALESNYDSYIATTNFCESAKVKVLASFPSGNASMEVVNNYVPNFKCFIDGNRKQYVSEKAALITADEVAMAGLGLSSTSANQNSFLYKNEYWWTMSPAAFNPDNGYALAWFGRPEGYASNYKVTTTTKLYPVISLNADVTVTGTGSSEDHWVIQ